MLDDTPNAPDVNLTPRSLAVYKVVAIAMVSSVISSRWFVVRLFPPRSNSFPPIAARVRISVNKRLFSDWAISKTG